MIETGILEDNIVKLRALEPEDIDMLYNWENDSKVWVVSNTLHPFSKFILEQYIQSSHQDIFQTRQLRLIISEKEKNKSVGCIDLFDFEPLHKRAGIGILIHASNDRGKGYAKSALHLLKQYCFDYLLLNQLYCNILEDNERSLKLFQTGGFEITGKKKKWIYEKGKLKDEYILQLLRNDLHG